MVMLEFFSHTYLLTIRRLGAPNPYLAFDSRSVNNLAMSILNLDGPSGRNFGKPFKVILGIGALAAVVAVASTLAANININSGPVEFGQGVAQTTACDDQITVTPYSTFINDSSTGTHKLTTVKVSGIDSSPDKCSGKTFVIKAYGEEGLLDLFSYNEIAFIDPPVIIRSDTYTAVEITNYGGNFVWTSGGTDDDDVFNDENVGDPARDLTNTSFTINLVSIAPTVLRTPLASAAAIEKITVETTERVDSDFIPWSSVTWGETDQSGPSIYANSLTSGKPSWLEEVTTSGYLEYSFTSNGMGILGDADGLTFPYVSTFSIPHNKKVKIEFVFSYYSECEDQGVILFSESATPIWGWGTVDNGLIGQWDCGYPVLGWSTGDTQPDIDGEWPKVLEIGAPYLGILEYDPNLPDSNLKLITKTYSGEVIDSVVVNGELLPTGEDYKIGFSSDSDGDEGDFSPMSFFKNLKITIG